MYSANGCGSSNCVYIVVLDMRAYFYETRLASYTTKEATHWTKPLGSSTTSPCSPRATATMDQVTMGDYKLRARLTPSVYSTPQTAPNVEHLPRCSEPYRCMVSLSRRAKLNGQRWHSCYFRAEGQHFNSLRPKGRSKLWRASIVGQI